MKVLDLWRFIHKRHSIYCRRVGGATKPWTDDLILQSYRFCNMYRELDTETQWIAQNWRTPHAENPDLWFAMVVARLLNWHETLDELGFPVPWNCAHFMGKMIGRRERGSKVFNGAYIVSTNGRAMGKLEYIADEVLSPMWQNRSSLRPYKGDTLASFAARLRTCMGMAGFMVGQVIADTKYTFPLLDAGDWMTWAISGPGSRRGMNRVLDLPLATAIREDRWLQHLQQLSTELAPLIQDAGFPCMHNQDLQNCLCEFDKYERVRLGEGRPKSSYPGRA